MFRELIEQFKELDILERVVFIFCCFGMFILGAVFFYLLFDIFLLSA